MDPHALAALLAKYRTLLALRARYAAEGPAPRHELKALAAAFPGALRELDDLLPDELQRRHDELAAAVADRAPVLPWMRATEAFHRLARGALACKAWLRSRPEETSDALVAAVGEGRLPREALAFATQLPVVRSPPRGRIVPLVLEQVAAELGVPPTAARRLVFGRGAREPALPLD